MKKAFVLLLILNLSFLSFSQAKKNLSAKKSPLKSAAKKTEKPAPVIVYNEDFEKGEELFGLNKPEEAIPYFEKCIDSKDVNPDVWIHLGVAYYQTGDFTRALACCTKGLTKENTDHKILAYNAGNSAYALTNYARADACYAIAIKEDENFAPAYLNRANSQLKQDHLQDAKENYIKYLEKESDTYQKEEIERLIALLDAEIIRRAKEKPEKIDLDFANVKNDEMMVKDDAEKVIPDLPDDKKITEKRPEELVKAEVEASPVPEKEEIVLQHVNPEEMQVEKEEEPLIAELVEPETANPPAPKLIEGAQKFENEKLASVKQKETPVKGEAVHEEDLADAIYNLPAGAVTLAPLTYGFSPYSPNSKVKKEYFNVTATDSSKVASYTFEILDESGNTVRTMKGKKLPSKLEWDGKTDEGILGDGRFTSRITVDYKQGGSVTAESTAFSCFSEVPQVSLVPQTENFSPDGDGVDDVMKLKVNYDAQGLADNWRFEVKRNNKTIYSHGESGNPPSEIEWDGKTSSGETVKNGDKLSYSIAVTDNFGVQAADSGKTEVTKSKPDPVVAKKVEVSENQDGTVDIQIPTLSFKINSSDLINTASNNDTIKKVYDILVDEKYEDYKVTITGYVNPDGEKWTKEEVLLALRRAQSVENRLRELGVDPNRMKALAGDGKTNNKEYNRRVEFKLEK